MMWRGISSDTTDVDDTPGVSTQQYNTRMRVEGELQRRYGFISTDLPPDSGPILSIASAPGFVVTGTGDVVVGSTPVSGLPVGPVRVPPGVGIIPGGDPTGLTLTASTTGSSPSDGEGVIFRVFVDGLLFYTSACMENGSDFVIIPVTAAIVTFSRTYGCNGGPDPTTGTVS